MIIRVHSEGAVSNARTALVRLFAQDALKPLEEDIRSVSLRVPAASFAGAATPRKCQVEVELMDGRIFSHAKARPAVADGIEAVVHAARHDVFVALGRPFPARSRAASAAREHDRRAIRV